MSIAIIGRIWYNFKNELSILAHFKVLRLWGLIYTLIPNFCLPSKFAFLSTKSTKHVGDSRIYCYSESRLQQLTEDQVINGRLAGYLGRPEKLPVLYGEGEYAGKKFLLCSDGLYKKLDSENLSKYCAKVDKKNISRILDKLVQAAVNNGEMDNISAAFVVCER